MIVKQKENEPRVEYLLRVLEVFMDCTVAGEQIIRYDGADCDGFCLAEDIANCVEDILIKADLNVQSKVSDSIVSDGTEVVLLADVEGNES